MTASAYLGAHSPDRAVTLPEGSWGAGGGHYVWMNHETAWTWHLIYDAEKDYRDLVGRHGRGHDGVMSRAELETQGREFIALQRLHLNLEEAEAFPLLDKVLTEEDWKEVEAHQPRHDDPVFEKPDQLRFSSLFHYLEKAEEEEEAGD
jgi:hemerythrin-like domain-containing protein